MSDEEIRPAWSQQFTKEAIQELAAEGPLAGITREWAWGGSRGKGVRVAIVDSGVEHDHPALGEAVRGGVLVEYDTRADNNYRIKPDDKPSDLAGHGTACAGIIHSIAPDAEIYSVRVLGRNMGGRAIQFAAGLDWAIENDMQVINLSLSTSLEEYFGLFHDLADQAYFKNSVLVSAVNNISGPSYPSQYSSVISVAANEENDPFTYYYNPNPPVEFGAPGIDVEVAWNRKQYITATGNSFAAPHIAALTALIRSKHPHLTPFQVKTVLVACASNPRQKKRSQ
ncbi:MAG TPA: S8 family serine peptidase [Anaerolineales bacterium]|nr:S8 family serine peptidase [Anaerolineales bacterium]